MSEWQPIETAPKDGTEIFTAKMKPERFGSYFYAVRSKWRGSEWVMDLGDRWSPFDPDPTHWMPLPAPPTPETPPSES